MASNLLTRRWSFVIVGITGIGLVCALGIFRSLYTTYRHGVAPFPVRAVKAWWVWRRIASATLEGEACP